MPLTTRFRVGARNDVVGEKAGSHIINLQTATQPQYIVFLNLIQNPDKALALITNRRFNPITSLLFKNKTTLSTFYHKIPGRGPE